MKIIKYRLKNLRESYRSSFSHLSLCSLVPDALFKKNRVCGPIGHLFHNVICCLTMINETSLSTNFAYDSKNVRTKKINRTIRTPTYAESTT